MKKHFFILPVFLCLLCTAPLSAQSGMTDQQVLSYVKEGVEAGKDQRTIATELARRGVTREQAERVRAMYERQTNTSSATGEQKMESRLRKQAEEDNTATALEREQPEAEQVNTRDAVYGRNIFNTRNLSFEPSQNMATPPNYRLGPGDEVIIDIWGASQSTIRQTISPEGTIQITQLGPVYLSGMTVAGAESYLKKELTKIYADASNQIKVTLGNTRTIQINIMGEVRQPGTYALSGFSTLFHALYRAGGVSGLGSLRNIQLIRNGKKIATVDVYDFITKGKMQDDIKLQEGDVIIVPTYDALIQISGNVKRPMRYEMKKDETLSTLIKYAGGFTSNAYTKNIRIVRQNGTQYEVKNVESQDFSVCKLYNGDVITVDAILEEFTNKLEIKGAVYRPGIYELSGKVSTVRELVQKADGLMDDAFTNRAVLYRERPNKTKEVLQIDIKALMDMEIPDIPLQKNDILYIPSIHDLEDLGDVQIFGQVAQPGNYPYADNMTLEDLVISAGGLREAASVVRVDVSRRIKDAKGTEIPREISQTFSFSLKDGFVVEGQPGFVLQPYDQVFVRRSPVYQVQQNVSIGGEIVYGGTYALSNKNERISELVAKAGGPTPFAYVKGAKLRRQANAEEIQRMHRVLSLLRRQVGEAMLDSLGIRVENSFIVGIDLEEALKNPGSDADIVLREGDQIFIPEYNNTVKIDGAVMMPNTVTYQKGKNVKYYISQAGGYGDDAKKRKKFIIYMNGQIAEVKRNSKGQIEPGCEIIVPSKRRKNTNWSAILSGASAIGSLGIMAATIANLTK